MFLHLRAPFATWYLREDSRFFANGLFSAYDLLRAFLTPTNSMGQYRPVTRLLWWLPELAGGLSPGAAHALSCALLLACAWALARLTRLWFGSAFAGTWGALLFVLLPVNLKPLYWISAWHNSAAVLFSALACLARVESWRRDRHARALRALSLASLFFALASREVAFAAVPALLLVDWMESGARWPDPRRSRGVLAVAGAVFLFLFVLHDPFPQLRVTGLTRGAGEPGPAGIFLAFVNDSFLGRSDVLTYSFGPLTCIPLLALAFASFGALRWRPFSVAGVFTALGAAPFVALRFTNLEYGALTAFGLSLALAAALALAIRRFGAALPGAVALAALGLVYVAGEPSRAYYRERYVGQGERLRGLVGALGRLSGELPRFRPVRIEEADVPFLRDQDLVGTMHFLAPGVDELVPGLVLTFRPETLGIPDGNGLHDPRSAHWGGYLRGVAPPVRLSYGRDGFRRLP